MKTRLLVAATLLAASFALRAATDDPLVAHEWGTFTSVQGGNGAQLSWTPLIRTDLPEFVYSCNVLNGGISGVILLAGKSVPSTVRMETPVIYFYSEAERVVDVRVLFPMGRITEWYPQATSIGPYVIANKTETEDMQRSAIEWNGVRILPRDTKEVSAGSLIRDREDSLVNHYYAARKTDANLLRVTSRHARSAVEHERDLFYRGVGFFDAPMTVKLDADERELTLSTKYRLPLTDIFVLTVRQGMMRYQKIDAITAQADSIVELDAQPFGALRDVRERVMREMALALASQGLYAKEAQAMVDTWKDQWFEEEGTRVLYLLPDSWTDQILPLEISPQPDSIVRVMVGRAELIAPSMERELRRHIVAFGSGDAQAKRQAVTNAKNLRLGRFFEPATQLALGENPSAALSKAAWELAALASNPEHIGLQVAQSATRDDKAQVR